MKLALIQMNSGDDKAANLAQAESLIVRAIADERPDWISLPEVFSFMGGTRADKVAAAEAFPDGAAYRLMQNLARRHGVFIHAGSMLEAIPGEERLGNTTIAFNRAGEEVARYRKIHMFDVTTPDGQDYRESATMKPGEEVVTYDCEGVIIGCAICYDLRFPALFAATTYATLYGRSPVGSSYVSTLDPAIAQFLQQIAWDTTQSYVKSH
jgi:nitrilase